MMNDYYKNIINMFCLMNYFQRLINGQKQGYWELEKKVFGIVLDVVEVNNVFEKKVNLFFILDDCMVMMCLCEIICKLCVGGYVYLQLKF